MTETAVRLTGIQKHFGAVHANRGASLTVGAGEIHALVGENGAGKSTLMKILAGMIAPDGGTIEVSGRDVTGWQTADAIAAGVGMVHQHFMLVPTLTVAENVVLGREPAHGVPHGVLFDRARAVRDVTELCVQSGLQVPPERLVADLSVGEAQRVEILKALYRGAKVLLLDEPTAVLSPPEVQELWRVLRRLRDGGATIVLITHKLDEVMAVSEHITVMRAGETVATMTTSRTSPVIIAKAMVGRDVDLAIRSARTMPAVRAASLASEIAPLPALDVRRLVVRGARIERAVNDVSFSVAPGEILGIAGVEGNGQAELVEAIAGLRPVASGSVLLGTTDITGRAVYSRGEAGLSHIPDDRQRRGLILDYSIAENLILGQQHRYTSNGMLDQAAILDNARARIIEYDIRPTDPLLRAGTLSGGNQQKIVVARELSRGYSVLLASQPTRGVDVGAIEFIHAELRKARDAGKGVLLVSAELREILTLSDRIAVMYGGKFVALLPRNEASEEILGPFMTGARRAQVA
jgi:simple sugar transport system ATP-binding protein